MLVITVKNLFLLLTRSGRKAGEAWIHRLAGLPRQVWHRRAGQWSRLLHGCVVICKYYCPVHMYF